jgi:hypothetical protein
LRTESALKGALAEHFSVLDFRTEPYDGSDGLPFQAVTARRR